MRPRPKSLGHEPPSASCLRRGGRHANASIAQPAKAIALVLPCTAAIVSYGIHGRPAPRVADPVAAKATASAIDATSARPDAASSAPRSLSPSKPGDAREDEPPHRAEHPGAEQHGGGQLQRVAQRDPRRDQRDAEEHDRGGGRVRSGDARGRRPRRGRLRRRAAEREVAADEARDDRRGEAGEVEVGRGVEHHRLVEPEQRDARARRREPHAADGEVEVPHVDRELLDRRAPRRASRAAPARATAIVATSHPDASAADAMPAGCVKLARPSAAPTGTSLDARRAVGLARPAASASDESATPSGTTHAMPNATSASESSAKPSVTASASQASVASRAKSRSRLARVSCTCASVLLHMHGSRLVK